MLGGLLCAGLVMAAFVFGGVMGIRYQRRQP